MTDKEDFSKKEEKILRDALQSSSVEPPEFITKRIRKAARDSLENEEVDTPKHAATSVWFKPLPLAACVIISFYAGKAYQDAQIQPSKSTPLVFQGDDKSREIGNENEWTEDKLLKAIAEAALTGDIQKAEYLIALYKEKYPKVDR